MLDDILWNSDGFSVVDSLLLRSGIKDWWKKGRNPSSSSTPSFTLHTDSSQPTTTYPILDSDLIDLESMSLTRQLFNEFRPFFRMFDDAALRPLATHPRFRGFEDPFESLFRENSSFGRTAQVELKEEGNSYVIEAELPGVKKENLDVSVGENGRSITIEGKVVARSADSQAPAQADAGVAKAAVESSGEATQSSVEGSSSTALSQPQDNGAVAASGNRQWETRSSFSRTIWLPERVDSTKVSGKLEDGVLRLEIPKMAEEESGRTRINVQ
ncbi:hypothetical protein FRB90_003079 [Tulasnella sp. 427]|nr:hypothetical protein FRB90_003079 [Tulasnella sp. 427]